MKERRQETDDVIGQLTSLNQDLYGGGGFDQDMPGGLSASFAELSSIGNKDWNAQQKGGGGAATNQRDVEGDARSLARGVGYSGDAMADMGNADRTENLARAGASEQQLRIMNQSNAMLASKLQETEIVRAEVQEDARMKAEQLKALNEERYLLMNEIEREAGIRSELEADAKHKGDELRNVSVEKNLLLMKLQDEAEVKNRLADNLKKKDERMSSLFELNTQLISKFHAQETLKVQLEDELGEKDSHLAELDAEIKTLVGMLKAEENSRIKQEADSLTKDEEIHRLSQYNYEVTNKLAEKDRLLKTQGEQLRLMRDRSNQLYAKYSNAEEELQNQGAQLKLLSSHHESLAQRMGAPDIDNDVADMQEFDNVVRRSKGVLQEKPGGEAKPARLPAAAKGPPQGGGSGNNYYNDSAAVTTGWKQPGGEQGPPQAQYGGPSVSIPDPNAPRPGMPGGGEHGQQYDTTQPMQDTRGGGQGGIGNDGLADSYEALMQKTSLAQHLTDQLLGNGPAPTANQGMDQTMVAGQTQQAGGGMTQQRSPAMQQTAPVQQQQTAPAMPAMGAPPAMSQAPPAMAQQQASNMQIPGVPSAAQPLPASVIPSPIGNVGGAPSLHGAPVPANLDGGGPVQAQQGPGGYLAQGGQQPQIGSPMAGTGAGMTQIAGGTPSAMGGTGNHGNMGSTMNNTLSNTGSSFAVQQSPPSGMKGGPGGPGGGGGSPKATTLQQVSPAGGPGGDPDDEGYDDDDDEFDEVEPPEPPWLAEDLPSHDLAEMDVPVLPGTSDTSANEFHPEGKVARRDEMAVEGLGEEKVYAGGEPIIEGHIKPAEDVMEPGERLVIPVELEQVVPGKQRMPDQVVHEGDMDTTVYILDVKDKPQRRRTCQPPEGELPPSSADDMEAHIQQQTVPSRFRAADKGAEEALAAGMSSPVAQGGFAAPPQMQQMQPQQQQQMQPQQPQMPLGSVNDEQSATAAAAIARAQQQAQQQAASPAPAAVKVGGLAALKAAGKEVVEDNAQKGAAAIPAGKNLTMQEMAYFNRIYSLCRHNKYREIENLLEKGAPVDATDEFGNTPLIIAAQNGYKRMTKLLLRHNADINAQNNRGNTPLHFSYAYGFKVLAEYLKEKGADDTIRNDGGLTCYQGLGK